MRIGETKNILEKAIDESDRLVVRNISLFSGQAHQIENYADLVEALQIVSKMEWNKSDFTPVQAIIDKYGTEAKSMQINDEEYTQLDSYVSTVNAQFPIYLEVIRSLTNPQEETFINIKLPGKINSFAKLTKINNRLDILFKEFSVDGNVEFKGFDHGSDWYTICIVGGLTTYKVFIAGLKIAQEAMKFRTEYFNSEEAKIDYETNKAIFKSIEALPLEDYQEKKMENIIESKVKEAIGEIENKGAKETPELTNQIVRATTDLVKALGDGIEFHLSLNPPEYAKEVAGSLTIDYKKMRELTDKEKPKQISKGKD